jgi:methylisocitrate lyase
VNERSAQLRALIEQPGIVVLPGAYDCLSARLAEHAGFETVFTTGFGFAASALGVPDLGLMTASEILDRVHNIVNSVSVPLVADMDTGYGNPLNVIRTVSECVSLGVAGIILEDQEWPKKCGHLEGKRVIPMEDHVQKLRAAVDARCDSGLVIIARTDSRAVLGLDEALERGQAYYEAGADVVFIEAPQSMDELHAIAKAFPHAPLFANMIEGGKTPVLSPDALAEIGFKIVVYPLSSLFSAARAMQRVYKALKEHGTTDTITDMTPLEEFTEIVNVGQFRAWEQQYATPDSD